MGNLRYFLFLTFTLFAFQKVISAENSPEQSFSTQVLNLATMDEEIFIEPWLTYQKLLVFEFENSPQRSEQKLWWLLRKAQCENLLYFYTKFNETLTQAVKLMTSQTSIELQARIRHFQGLRLQRDGGYVESRQYFTTAMKLADKGHFHHLYVKAKQELAYTHSLAEIFETSLKLLSKFIFILVDFTFE